MAKELREFTDKDHKVTNQYYDLRGKYNGRNGRFIKKELVKLMSMDPDFFDSHLLLYEILQSEENRDRAEKVLDKAYERALKLILDDDGNWPDKLEWGWLENRHIIRTFINRAMVFWMSGNNEQALDLFRNLLKTNPGDNVGARDFILAIRMNLTAREFQSRFDKGGHYDSSLTDWFDENYKKFPDEFDWWDKAMEKYR